jgi:hypothetical protein
MEVDEVLRKQLLEKAISNREYAMKRITEEKKTAAAAPVVPVEDNLDHKHCEEVEIHLPASAKYKRRIFINAKNGLGNRLRAFASVYRLAQMVKAQLVLIWIPDHHCQAKFSDLFKLTALLKDVIILHEDVDLVEKEVCRYDIMENEYVIREKIIYNYMGSKEVYVNDNVQQDIYIISACVVKNKYSDWTKESEFLRKLEPQPAIAKKIAAFKKANDLANVIGVHVRMGQDPKTSDYEDISGYTEENKRNAKAARNSSHWTRFLTEMKRITKIKHNQKFFLCCDNPEAYAALLKEMKDNIIFVEKEVYDRSADQIVSALVDAKLLAETKYVLGSPWSSYTEMVERLSGKVVKLAGKNF